MLLILFFLFSSGCNKDHKVPDKDIGKSHLEPFSVDADYFGQNITDFKKTIQVDINKSEENNITNITIESEHKNLNIENSIETLKPLYKTLKHQNITEYSFENNESINQKRISFYGAIQDKTVSRSGENAVYFRHKNDALSLTNIPVEEGKWYIISGYMYIKSLPANVMRYYIEYRNERDQGLDIPNYPMFAVSKAGEWEEFILPVYIKKDLNITNIKFLIRNVGQPDSRDSGNSGVWIDDISIFEVKDSASLFGFTLPSEKKSFDGALVKVDALGNFSIKDKEGYKPFLPIIVYPGGDMQKWDKYLSKGFNTIICNTLDEAKKAVSLGMYWIWSLYDYGIYDGDENGYKRFENEYRSLKQKSPEILNKLLYFYWDNERYQLFDTVKHFSDTIKSLDIDGQGNRLRPFMMQLDFTMANPHYSNDTYALVDLQSCYANPMIFEANDPQNYQGVEFKGNYDGEFANFAIFENIPGVRVPKTVFVVNSPFGDVHLANTIFAAFARGGRGFAYWKDGGSQPKIETKSWWKDFNKTTEMMQQLLPLLRMPHWTSWELNVSLPDDEDGIVVGKRDFGSKHCMITASRSAKMERVHFHDLSSRNESMVWDYFTGEKVAMMKEGVFELLFTPRGYGVYCWENFTE